MGLKLSFRVTRTVNLLMMNFQFESWPGERGYSCTFIVLSFLKLLRSELPLSHSLLRMKIDNSALAMKLALVLYISEVMGCSRCAFTVIAGNIYFSLVNLKFYIYAIPTR